MKRIWVVLAFLLIGGFGAAAIADVLRTRAERADELLPVRQAMQTLQATLQDCHAAPDLRDAVMRTGREAIGLQQKYIEYVSQGFKTDDMVRTVQMTIDLVPFAVATCAGSYDTLPSR